MLGRPGPWHELVETRGGDLEETQAAEQARVELTSPTGVKEKQARSPRQPRRPLPDNLPVERIVEPPPCACGKCGSILLRKLGEVVSKTLECEPQRWKIVEHVREKCKRCFDRT